jgi:hypothetical protein
VQYPGYTQSYNRYSYCLNNPLKYTDPSGNKLKWWQWGLIGLGADLLTGGAISTTIGLTTMAGTTSAGLIAGFPISSLSASGAALYSTAAITSFSAIPILSTIDLVSSIIRSGEEDGWKYMDNWYNISISRFVALEGIFSYDKTANWYEWPLQIIHSLPGGEFLQDNIGICLAYMQNIGRHVDKSGFYEGRLILRLQGDYIGNNLYNGISFGHYVFGENMALHPNDFKYDLDLFAHEFGHTYQSRIMGPLYLFRIGAASAIKGGEPTEYDANRRGFTNLNMTSTIPHYSNYHTSYYKWWEHVFSPVLWPFMWMWNY